MNLIRSLMRRREFLVAFLSSTLTLAFGRLAKAFDLLFQTGISKASEKPATGENKPLKGIVVYYSATGNTAQVAEAIWRGMSSVIPCDVAPIKKINPEDMAKYDVMAIGAPNWYMRTPINVSIFTHDMPRMDGKHCIVFGTHGGMPWGQFWFMSRNILKKGMTIIGWSDWYGSDFLTPHSCVPDGEWGHPDSIDLAEAEAYGRQMVLNSIKISAGERNLIPRIPTPEIGSGSLWAPNGGEGKVSFAGGVANGTPKFDFTKCVYPRCNRCIENCPVNAIDFSVIGSADSIQDKPSTQYPLVLKQACHQCHGICERVCLYEAISYTSDTEDRALPKIHMTKCTYPKCTECIDNCPQDSIDFSVDPPVIHRWCDNESLCYGVCPENAIEASASSLHAGPGGGDDEDQEPMAEGPEERGERDQDKAPMAGGPEGRGEMGQVPAPMAGGPEGSGLMMGGMGGYTSRFRPLVTEECGMGRVYDLKTYPRIPINKKLWPHHIDES